MNYYWKGEVSLRSDASLRLLANTAVHAGPANELKIYFINKKSLKRATMSKDKCDPGCLLPFWPTAVKLNCGTSFALLSVELVTRVVSSKFSHVNIANDTKFVSCKMDLLVFFMRH